MNVRQIASAFALVFACASAQSAVITGPALPNTSSGWAYSGIGFVANRDSVLTHFDYLSSGNANTVMFVDANGLVLHSVSIAAGPTDTDVNVSWSLSAGQHYYLIGTTGDFRYTLFGMPAPSNEDIRLTSTGIFSQLANPVNYTHTGNDYWSTFTNITTSLAAADVPEPGTLPLFGVTLLAAFALVRRRARQGYADRPAP